jgi:hypothetical protein
MSASITYQNAEQEILSEALFQVYYRQMGTVALHFGVSTIYEAAQYLATTPRGGTLSWLLNGRLAQWNDVIVAPGYSDSPTISLWLGGSASRQKNTVLVRKGWWTFYLPSVVERTVTAVTALRPSV